MQLRLPKWRRTISDGLSAQAGPIQSAIPDEVRQQRNSLLMLRMLSFWRPPQRDGVLGERANDARSELRKEG
jgi:hypothetical protein